MFYPTEETRNEWRDFLFLPETQPSYWKPIEDEFATRPTGFHRSEYLLPLITGADQIVYGAFAIKHFLFP